MTLDSLPTPEELESAVRRRDEVFRRGNTLRIRRRAGACVVAASVVAVVIVLAVTLVPGAKQARVNVVSPHPTTTVSSTSRGATPSPTSPGWKPVRVWTQDALDGLGTFEALLRQDGGLPPGPSKQYLDWMNDFCSDLSSGQSIQAASDQVANVMEKIPLGTATVSDLVNADVRSATSICPQYASEVNAFTQGG